MEIFDKSTRGWERRRLLYDASLDKRPSVIYCPDNSIEAAHIVQQLQNADTNFTLKAGGHSAAGSSVENDQPVVDLWKLRSVYVDPVAMTATVAPGALIEDLDRATGRFGLATPSGTVSHTGVIGLSIGGGLGWLMGRFGLACDNIIRATYYSAGKRLVAVEGSDAMHTLRGNGAALGYIAELVIRVYEIESKFEWASLRLKKSQCLASFARLSEAIDTVPDSVGCSYSVLSTDTGEAYCEVDAIFPANDLTAASWVRETFLAMNGHEGIRRIMSYPEVQRCLDSSFPFGMTRSYRRSICVNEISLGYLEDFLDLISRSSTFTTSLTFDILHGEAVQLEHSMLSSFPRSRFVALMVTKWTSNSSDKLGRERGRQLYKEISEAHSAQEWTVYSNYSSEGSRRD